MTKLRHCLSLIEFGHLTLPHWSPSYSLLRAFNRTSEKIFARLPSFSASV